MQPHQLGPPNGRGTLAFDHRPEGTEIERFHRQALQWPGCQRALEPRACLGSVVRSRRRQQSHGLICDPAERIFEHRRARTVEPRPVVHRDQYGRAGSELAQRAECCSGNRSRAGRFRSPLAAQPGGVERVQLRSGKVGEASVGHRRQQVRQVSEDERRFRLQCPAAEHREATVASHGRTCVPQRALADACVALNEQRMWAFDQTVEEPLDMGPLGFAAENTRGSAATSTPALLTGAAVDGIEACGRGHRCLRWRLFLLPAGGLAGVAEPSTQRSPAGVARASHLRFIAAVATPRDGYGPARACRRDHLRA